jgi:hypothetical protein
VFVSGMSDAEGYLGGPSGLSTSSFWTGVDTEFHGVVSHAGDVNGDGFGDLLLGTVLFLGTSAGPSDSSVWTGNGSLGVAAGDVNGDGFDEILTGSAVAGAPDTATLFYGNGGRGRAQRPRQVRVGGGPIAPGGVADSESGFRLRGSGPSPATGFAARMRWEVRTPGVPTVVASGTAPPIPGGFEATIGGLSAATYYAWRLRFESDSPAFPRSPWLTIETGAGRGAQLRTAGELPDPGLAIIAPKSDAVFFADVPTVYHLWNRGPHEAYRVQWSNNLGFNGQVETSEVLAATDAGIQVYAPAPALLNRILRLARNPDFGTIPVFWRVVPLGGAVDTASTGIEAFQVAPAAASIPTRPEDNRQIDPSSAPLMLWDTNHNERFLVRFSGSPSLAAPRLDSGAGFTIVGDPGQICWVPEDVWAGVQTLPQAGSNVVYWSVFAKDALDRVTWSPVRRILLDPVGEVNFFGCAATAEDEATAVQGDTRSRPGTVTPRNTSRLGLRPGNANPPLRRSNEE